MQRTSVGGSDRSWEYCLLNNFLGEVDTFQNILEVFVEKIIRSNIVSRNFQKSFAQASLPCLGRH